MVSGVVFWVGATLPLSPLRRFTPALVAGPRPYTPGGSTATEQSGPFSVEPFQPVVSPLSFGAGEWMARLFRHGRELPVVGRQK